jgi:hypothetical protein
MATISLPARLFSGVISTTPTQIWTCPAGETDVITSVTVANLTDVAKQCTLTFAGTDFFKNLDLAPRQITVLDFKQVLNAGDSISVSATAAAAVSLFISGVKVTNI